MISTRARSPSNTSTASRSKGPSPSRQWLRFLIALSAATLVWLVSASAFAAAPQCDERGAITFAPNPRLEEPNASLAPVNTEYLPQEQLLFSYEQNHSGSIDLEFEIAPAVVPSCFSMQNLIGDVLAVGAGELLAPSHAERDRLDRPPRGGSRS